VFGGKRFKAGKKKKTAGRFRPAVFAEGLFRRVS
jgi:hypothetical protein